MIVGKSEYSFPANRTPEARQQSLLSVLNSIQEVVRENPEIAEKTLPEAIALYLNTTSRAAASATENLRLKVQNRAR